MTLTILTTSFHRKDLLRKTLESVLAQSYPDIEQLVIDGDSRDGTKELLAEMAKEFRSKGYGFRWVSERDSGQGEAMNKGLRMATGEFVMILNSDDFLKGDSVASYMKEISRHSDIDVLYGDHESLYEDGRQELIRHRLYSLHDVLFRGYQVPQSATVFRRSLIDRVGSFDESLRHVAEHDLYLRMMKAGARFAYIPEVLQVTLEHAGRKTTAFTSRSWRETKKVNFRQGGSRFSPFYLLYIKNVYFRWFWNAIRTLLPGVHDKMKSIFYRRYR